MSCVSGLPRISTTLDSDRLPRQPGRRTWADSEQKELTPWHRLSKSVHDAQNLNIGWQRRALIASDLPRDCHTGDLSLQAFHICSGLVNSGTPDTASSTSYSLLQRACGHDPCAWQRISDLYVPLVYGWARKSGLQDNDAVDVVQEVFQSVATRLPSFRHDRVGDSFRGWLYTITRNKIRDHFRDAADRPGAAGGTAANAQLHEFPAESNEDDVSRLTADLAYRAAELMKVDFEARTWQVFWRVVVDQVRPADVAGEFDMSVAAVYQAKSRVLRHLRHELDGLLDG